MKLGLIGLAGAGKTTVFEALTTSPPDGDHRRESRIATVRVPDSRVDRLSAMYKPRKTIYAQVAYLLPMPEEHVKEKARQQSIWTQVRDCDALVQVVRNFQSYGSDPPTPWQDFQSLDQELVLSDLMVVEKKLERLELDQKRGKKPDAEEMALLHRCGEMLNAETPLRYDPELATAKMLRGYAFLSAKPKLTLFNNTDEDDMLPPPPEGTRGPENPKGLDTTDCVVIRGKLEQELSRMNAEEAREFLAEFEIQESAMQRIIAHSYAMLGLISFFTVGEDEVRAWTIARDTPAVEAAEVIHSDIKKGFIRAEVVGYDDLLSAGSLAEARKNATLRLEGKTYLVADGDIINFRFNV